MTTLTNPLDRANIATPEKVKLGSADRLTLEELRRMDAYWRACNYLAAGMIYLRANPLLREPLKPEHIKQRLLGHWGASPGLSFTYIHLNRLINKYDLDAIFLAGPGHGAPGVLAPVYLEGAYSEIYPNKGDDEQGMLEFLEPTRRHVSVEEMSASLSWPGGFWCHRVLWHGPPCSCRSPTDRYRVPWPSGSLVNLTAKQQVLPPSIVCGIRLNISININLQPNLASTILFSSKSLGTTFTRRN
jgi:hypothetical protein